MLHEGHDPKIIWQLGQSSAEKGTWVQGRVEVTPIEAANKPYQVKTIQNTNGFLSLLSFLHYRLS